MEHDVTVRTTLRWLLRPFTARSTYLRWTHLGLGAVVAVPYVVAGEVLRLLLVTGMLGFRMPELLAVGCGVVLVALALTGTAAVPHVRRLEQGATRELLGVDLGEPDQRNRTTWSSWWRTGAWMVAHLSTGLLIGFLTISVAPVILVLLFSPMLPSTRVDMMISIVTGPFGLGRWWAPLVALALFVAGYVMVISFGMLLERLAPPLLGPSAQDQLATARRRVAQLAERNRLASELHDSVGHALSVVTLQAGAAGRVLDSDPAFAREALTAIEDSTRRALDDLDHVLGLLREDRPDRAPIGTLDDLDRLVRSTEAAGLEVTADVEGDVSRVPGPVSREAYRAVREGLTNALRHAGKVRATVHVAITEDVTLTVRNPRGPGAVTGRSHGLGLTGIEQRVQALGGESSAGQNGESWCLQVRIPLRSTP